MERKCDLNRKKIPLVRSGENINVNKLTTKELLNLRRKLAKRLNQRMKRLEDKGFTAERGGAYADYQDLLNRFFGGAKRVPENLTTWGKGTFKSQVKALQKILKEKTSTVQGWREVIDKRLETFKVKYGIDFKSNNEMFDFIHSEEFKKVASLYDSKQALRIIGKKQSDGADIDEIQESLKEFRSKTDRNVAEQIALKLGFTSEASALKYRGS